MCIRTGYSFRTAYGHLEAVADRLLEIGWTTGPVCDRSNTFSYNRWTQICKSKDLRPIYGIELAVSPDVSAEKPVVDYWRFMALGSLEPLHDLLWLASSQSRTFPMGGYEPMLSYEQATTSKGVIRISGSRLLTNHLSEVICKITENAFDVNDLSLDKIPPIYVPLCPSLSKALYNQAKAMRLPFIAISDNVYPAKSDRQAYLVAMGRRAQPQIHPQHILSDEELRAACWYASDADFEVALKNRETVIKIPTAQLRKATILRPKVDKTLRQMCEEGATKKGCDLSDPVYAERLDRELALISEKKFDDYFFIVSDFMQWAKSRMVVGPGRGSSSGSLVCYLLDITVADPIKWDLVFERFIDITRMDYPDIDVDLSDERRELVFEYLEDKYGKERVARLGTVTTFQSKSALKAAAMAIGVPQWMVDAASNSVIKRSMGDSRADYKVADSFEITDAGRKLITEYPDMIIAAKIEAHPTNPGQHSAGVVMTNEPVKAYVGVDAHTKTAMVDWQDAKDLDLLKVDILGLTQLSIFEHCLKKLGIPDVSGFLETLPLDDQKAFDVLNKHQMAGIFQFQGSTSRQTILQIKKVDDIEDIVSLTALNRPGPLGSGGTEKWIKRKNGEEATDAYHPAFLPYLEKTFGIMVYQEQVMKICREIGGMSWHEVTDLRKAMGKSLGMEYFNNYRAKYLPNAVAKGIPEDKAVKMWDGMCAFGMYAFNRAHALAYALITYYCCWLKAHHPLEFAAASLDAEHEPEKQIAFLRELRAEGIDYISVDPATSTESWSARTDGNRSYLVGPLTLIDGIGPAAVEKIMEARRTGEQLTPALAEKLAGVKTRIDSLYPIADAVKDRYPDLTATPKPNIQTRPTPINTVFETKAGRDVVVIGVVSRNSPLNENEPGRVAKRGYPVKGPTAALNFHLKDDTGDIFCKVSRFDFTKLAKPLVNGKLKESIFAIKGNVPEDFRMIWVKAVRYLGELDGSWRELDSLAPQASSGYGDADLSSEPRTGRPDGHGQVAQASG
jgi:DNA-directed DNA polymerase III PolC